MMPHAMPPSSIPAICMFSSSTPEGSSASWETPSEVRLGTRTDAEENQVVDVNEVAKGGDENGKIRTLARAGGHQGHGRAL